MIEKTYFVIAHVQGLHVDVYTNEELTNMLGCYPIHWFESYKVVDHLLQIESVETVTDQVIEEDILDQAEEPAFFEQMKLF